MTTMGENMKDDDRLTLTLADALVGALRDWDVRYVFGVSGANVEHVHDAVHRLGDGRLTSVMARREDGAAFMADGRARVHRTLGVCCATSGGGMMNLAVGLAESYAESVPVLALVGQPPAALEGRGAFQDGSGIGRAVDARAMLAAITKKTVKVDPARFWEQLRDAVDTALSGRPGPVALLLPRDVYEQPVGPRPADWPEDLADVVVTAPPDPAAVRRLFDAVRAASKPVLVLGHGVRRSPDGAAVVDFARRAGVPVATTMSARAEFPNDDPLFLGVVGVTGHPSAHAVIGDADLVVVAGAGLNVMTRGPLGALDPARVAVVNIDPDDPRRAVDPGIVVAGDVGAVARLLLEHLAAEPFAKSPFPRYELSRFVPRPADPVDRTPHPRDDGDDLTQSEAITALSAWLPTNGHIVLDAGNCASAVIHLSDVPPGTSSTIALGAGGMGYSLGAAVGAQLGSPEGARTMVFCGDGAFLMNGLEVHTAVDLGLPALYVIFNNGMHGMCVTRQQTFFDGRIECVSYTPVDIAAVARGLGEPDRLWVGSAGTLAELRERLVDYHERHGDRPGLLELRLPAEEVPPFTPFLPADEATTTEWAGAAS
ncbi:MULTISPECIES: thiamine pyrophosphate-binding protein [Saccharothrix]|uniref:thiamine pyrophosphate-binding protein n=1 Tax=Saccharothrix TaxID=2071 RepID=UPI000940502C|nr:thiamine pyrophosphate-binding protein [Saccharothrix sp. CB00851]OKI25185.1 acetolactate synthase [Saccharothrix sp. CB00851]